MCRAASHFSDLGLKRSRRKHGAQSGWIDLYGSWKRSALELLRVVGTLRGLDTAACVADLPTVPDVA